jgi:predicted outer membrane repeat protein
VNNKGSLTVTNCKLGDNKATPGFGGAIYNFLGRFKVTGTTFTNNTSPKGGGAIYTQDSVGTIYLTNNTFSYNNAYNGRGGGLYHCHGTINMTDNIFTGNKASINGGAIYLDSTQHPSISYTKLYIKNSNFKSNLATNYAGAIYNNGTLSVNSCNFTSNSASTVSGGAITNAQGVLSVTKSTFNSNKAPKHYGGGIYNYRGKATVTYSNFTSNTAYRGGAMYNDHGSLTSTKNVFLNNKP